MKVLKTACFWLCVLRQTTKPFWAKVLFVIERKDDLFLINEIL